MKAFVLLAALAVTPLAAQDWYVAVRANRYLLKYPNAEYGKPLLTNLYTFYGYRFPTDLPIIADRFDDIYVTRPDGSTVPAKAPKETGHHAVDFEITGPGAYIASLKTNPMIYIITVKDREGRVTTMRRNKLEVPEGYELVPNENMFLRHMGKTVLHVRGEGARDEIVTRPLGHEMEFVPERNPAHVRVGEELRVQLLYQGKPYAGPPIRVQAENILSQFLGGAGKWSGDTGKDGKFALPITVPGIWTILASIKEPATGEFARKVDYTRYRATLTFETPGLEMRWD